MNTTILGPNLLKAMELAVKIYADDMQDDKYICDFYESRRSEEDLIEDPQFKIIAGRCMQVMHKSFPKGLYALRRDIDRIGPRSWKLFKSKFRNLDLRKGKIPRLVLDQVLMTEELILIPVIIERSDYQLIDVIILSHQAELGKKEIYFEDWIRTFSLPILKVSTSWN